MGGRLSKTMIRQNPMQAVVTSRRPRGSLFMDAYPNPEKALLNKDLAGLCLPVRKNLRKILLERGEKCRLSHHVE